MLQIEERQNKKIPGKSSLFITFPYSKEFVDTLKSAITVGDFNKKTNVWEVPVTDLNRILTAFNPLTDVELSLLPETLQTIEPLEEIELDTYRTKPFSYQEEGIKYGLTHNKWLLLDAPGLGKTLQMIYLAEERKRRNDLEHCLIICGINTLKFNWKKEIEKHSRYDCRILGQKINRKNQVVVGGMSDRISDLENVIDEFFVITNIETLRNKDVVKLINKGENKFDMIVVDEVHTCKSPTSQQGANLLKLTSSKYRIALTGTLLVNNPLDCYVPLTWVEAEHCTYSNFKYYYYNYGGIFNNEFLGYRNVDVLKDQLASCSLRRTKDLLDLPEKTIIKELVEMNPQQQQFYENIKKGIISQVDKVHMSTANLLAMVARLRQATECPSILTSENIKSEKVNRAIDLVDQIISSGEKVVIFSTFKATLDVLYEELKDYNPLLCTGDIDDSIISSNVDLFQQDDTHKVLLATTAKLGTGQTLHRATHMIFISSPWTASGCEQCEDRIHRIGSKNPVFIHYLICNDTIDQRVEELVRDKGIVSDYIIDNIVDERAIDNLRKYICELN